MFIALNKNPINVLASISKILVQKQVSAVFTGSLYPPASNDAHCKNEAPALWPGLKMQFRTVFNTVVTLYLQSDDNDDQIGGDFRHAK